MKLFNLARSKGLKSKVECCDHCNAFHCDKGRYVRKHKVHRCSACGWLFNSSDQTGHTVGNPLADVFNDVCKIKFLSFTHRAAHGGDDD